MVGIGRLLCRRYRILGGRGRWEGLMLPVAPRRKGNIVGGDALGESMQREV